MTTPMSDAEKPELRRANDNPWYCLATLVTGHDRQPTTQDLIQINRIVSMTDGDLSDKNCVAWNRWMAAALSQEQRTYLVSRGFSARRTPPAHGR